MSYDSITGAVKKSDGASVFYDGMGKMSKSKNNGIDPQTMIDRYGADAVRLFTMFAAPPEQSLEWSDAGLEGSQRFIKRFWKQVHQHLNAPAAPALQADQLSQQQQDMRRKTHETIQKVSDDIERRTTFNTAIAAIMELSNTTAKFTDMSDQGRAVRAESLSTAVLLMSPFTPHLCHTLWQAFSDTDAILKTPWPVVDEGALVKSNIDMMIQVNGKLRSKITIDANMDRDTIQQLALADEKVQGFITDMAVRKIIVVPNKLVNIVVS